VSKVAAKSATENEYAFAIGEYFLGRFNAADAFVAFFKLCREMGRADRLQPQEWRDFLQGKVKLEAMRMGVGTYWAMTRDAWAIGLKNRWSGYWSYVWRMLDQEW